eukprot:TRINITY_DN24287_c0_g1_i1.p1 TRINITY_DN24287_c0_g1~~TRINITY_DN24287_c0_g1_i1.p1  ORF type:complete len:655 (-),score=98.83 TRINITY_DN24287_c0_g1_i1:189-2153(-)
MGRGEEFTKRKHNKAARKRMRAETGDLNPLESAAAKRRRRKASRRVTEVMCYSLPTDANPFNEPELRGNKSKSTNHSKAGQSKAAKSAPSKATPSKRRKLEGDEGKAVPTVRRAFWLADSRGGAAHLTGLTDARLPPAFLEAARGLFETGANEGLAGQGSGIGDGTYKEPSGNVAKAMSGDVRLCASDEALGDAAHKSNQGDWTGSHILPPPPDNFHSPPSSLPHASFLQRECWEGCLRGRDILAVLPSPHSSVDSPHHLPSSSQINRPPPGTSPVASKIDASAELSLKDRMSTYLLPAAVHVSAQRAAEAGRGPIVLILVKGKEAAVAARRAMKGLLAARGLRCLCIHEGAEMEKQAAGLEVQAAEMLVGTPGRIWGLVDQGALSLARVTFLVFDEADELVALEDGKKLLSSLKKRVHPQCQTVLLSRTYPVRLCHVAEKVLNDPIHRATSDHSPLAKCAGMVVTVEACLSDEKKLVKVLSFLESVRASEEGARSKRRIVVLVDNAEKVGPLVGALQEAGHSAGGVHRGLYKCGELVGDFKVGKTLLLVLPQNDMERYGRDMKADTVPLLVLYDFPVSIDQFATSLASVARRTIHGRALALFSPDRASLASSLVKFLQECGMEVDPNVALMAKAFDVVKKPKARGRRDGVASV